MEETGKFLVDVYGHYSIVFAYKGRLQYALTEVTNNPPKDKKNTFSNVEGYKLLYSKGDTPTEKDMNDERFKPFIGE